ncbi:MAG TPA: ABC transporter C-terminal domain-containing protein, partial [Thermoanaerobaculia bacterium]|nr:ABC transporter C-terminal domain-containing protein [Thermoanaerobaculia bacterium]
TAARRAKRALDTGQPGATVSVPRKKIRSSAPDRAAERRRAKNERILSTLEEEIARLEDELRNLDLALSNPDVFRDGGKARQVTAAREAARKTLEAKMWEWEETSRKLQVGEGVPA